MKCSRAAYDAGEEPKYGVDFGQGEQANNKQIHIEHT